MKLDIYNQKGSKLSKKVDLNKDVFGIDPSEHSVYLVIKSELEKYVKLGFLRDDKIVFRAGKVMLAVNSSNKNKIKGVVDGFSATRQTCFIQPISLVELTNRLNELEANRNKEITKILKIMYKFGIR